MLFKTLAGHLKRGQHGEKLAAKYLKQQGLAIIANNVRTKHGEIDLIARDGNALVFVEVRTRSSSAWVSAAESITPAKQHKWQKSSTAYLQQHHGNQPPPCRFDAVCITIDSAKSPHIEWIRGVM